jgi:hypothetical protein
LRPAVNTGYDGPAVACDRNRNLPLLALLVVRDGGACWYCGRDLDFARDVTVEHLIPKSRGGPDARWNLALAHGRCNRGAAAMRFTEKLVFRERLRSGWPAPPTTATVRLGQRAPRGRGGPRQRWAAPLPHATRAPVAPQARTPAGARIPRHHLPMPRRSWCHTVMFHD